MAKPQIHIINQQLEPLDNLAVPERLLASGRSSLITQAVNSYLANQRHAMGHAKTRGEVTGSSVKIYRQKGTGRARHGDRQAPLFVGGGKSHGPTGTQNYTRRLAGTLSRQAICAVISDKLAADKLLVVDQLAFDQTKKAASFFSQLRQKYAISHQIGFIAIAKDPVVRFLRNLPEVDVLIADSLNAYRLLNCDFLLISQSAYHLLNPDTAAPKEKK